MFKSITPDLGAFYNNVAYSSLFDRYRINKIWFRFWWDHTVWDPAIGAATDNQKTARPIVYTCKDYDDDAVSTGLDSVCNYRNMKVYSGSSFKFGFKPSVLMDVDSHGSTVHTPKWKVWLDLANRTIPHYCLKLAIFQPVNMIQQVLRYQMCASVSFAGRR